MKGSSSCSSSSSQQHPIIAFWMIFDLKFERRGRSKVGRLGPRVIN